MVEYSKKTILMASRLKKTFRYKSYCHVCHVFPPVSNRSGGGEGRAMADMGYLIGRVCVCVVFVGRMCFLFVTLLEEALLKRGELLQVVSTENGGKGQNGRVASLTLSRTHLP